MPPEGDPDQEEEDAHEVIDIPVLTEPHLQLLSQLPWLQNPHLENTWNPLS